MTETGGAGGASREDLRVGQDSVDIGGIEEVGGVEDVEGTEDVGGLEASLLEGARVEEREEGLEDREIEERMRQRRGGREETNW